MIKISGLVITYNSASILSDCLAAMSTVCEEIVVVDSFSSDNTREICSSFSKVLFVQQEWLGFGTQKNFGASLAKHDHILSVDSDEVLSENLICEINRLKEKNEMPPVVWFNRLNNYYGKFLKHGLESRDHKPRLYNKKLAEWNNSPVHEKLVTERSYPKYLLEGDLFHYTIPNISEHLKKINEYSSLDAGRLFQNEKKFSVFKLFFSPFMAFIKAYFLKSGFRDGGTGLIVALMHANARFLRYAKLWENRKLLSPQKVT